MIDPSEYDDIIVTVAHSWGNFEQTLSQWIAMGPGLRPMVEIVKARRESTDETVDMSEIPLEYHNSRESRRLQRLGQLPTPWGPPPDVSLEAREKNDPPHIRRLVGE
jgi:hypothetical protein